MRAREKVKFLLNFFFYNYYTCKFLRLSWYDLKKFARANLDFILGGIYANGASSLKFDTKKLSNRLISIPTIIIVTCAGILKERLRANFLLLRLLILRISQMIFFFLVLRNFVVMVPYDKQIKIESCAESKKVKLLSPKESW